MPIRSAAPFAVCFALLALLAFLAFGLAPPALLQPRHTARATQAFPGLVGDIDSSAPEAVRGHAEVDCSYAALRPRQYVAYKTMSLASGSLDGDLTKDVWAEVPWTEDFVDISTSTSPRLRTRAKLRWDDEFLYVAAQLQEPQLWATITEDDSVMYQDNDFEVFVDPNATTHYYKEYEMNAFNKSWDLALNAPWQDGGHENSSRVFKAGAFNMRPPLRSAVKLHPEGVINDPRRNTEAWTLEIAFPLTGLMLNSTDRKPSHGTVWRINFSRVQWHLVVDPVTGQYKKAPACQSCPQPNSSHEDNWVWSPQGEIWMHLPERWALLQFSSEAVNSTFPSAYAEWASRSAAMAVYYAQKRYAQDHSGRYTDNFEALLPYSSPPFEICRAAGAQIELHSVGPDGSKQDFTATVSAGGGFSATVRGDRFLTVSSLVPADKAAFTI